MTPCRRPLTRLRKAVGEKRAEGLGLERSFIHDHECGGSTRGVAEVDKTNISYGSIDDRQFAPFPSCKVAIL